MPKTTKQSQFDIEVASFITEVNKVYLNEMNNMGPEERKNAYTIITALNNAHRNFICDSKDVKMYEDIARKSIDELVEIFPKLKYDKENISGGYDGGQTIEIAVKGGGSEKVSVGEYAYYYMDMINTGYSEYMNTVETPNEKDLGVILRVSDLKSITRMDAIQFSEKMDDVLNLKKPVVESLINLIIQLNNNHSLKKLKRMNITELKNVLQEELPKHMYLKDLVKDIQMPEPPKITSAVVSKYNTIVSKNRGSSLKDLSKTYIKQLNTVIQYVMLRESYYVKAAKINEKIAKAITNNKNIESEKFIDY